MENERAIIAARELLECLSYELIEKRATYITPEEITNIQRASFCTGKDATLFCFSPKEGLGTVVTGAFEVDWHRHVDYSCLGLPSMMFHNRTNPHRIVSFIEKFIEKIKAADLPCRFEYAYEPELLASRLIGVRVEDY